MFETHNIMPEQFLNKQGKPMVKVCLIKNENEYYKVAHPFHEIERMVKPTVVKGYVK